MLISAHEQNNSYYLANANSGNVPWVLAWTTQKLVTPAQVVITGGTYE